MKGTCFRLGVGVLSLGLAGPALAAGCPPAVGNPPVITTGAPTASGEYSWIVDRYPAQVFEQISGDTHGEAGVIRVGLGPCGYYNTGNGGRADSQVYPAPFFDLQGNKMSPEIIDGTAVVATSLYLPAEWDSANPFTEAPVTTNYVGDFQQPTLLLMIADGAGDPAAYPAVRFLNRSNTDSPPIVQIYDSLDTNAWITVPAELNYDGWNAIEVRFTKNDESDYVIEYLINGATVYTDNIQDVLDDPDDPGLRLGEVMLLGLNNNSSPYDIYWADTYAANLRASGDPLAGAVEGDLVLVGTTAPLDGAEIEGNLVLTGDGAATSGDGSFSGDGFVKDGGKLGGNVEIAGDLDNVSGIIAPGNSPGIVTIGGNYTGSLAGPDDTIPSGVFEADLSAISPVAGADYDQFNIGGTAAGVTAITVVDLSAPGSPLGDLDDIRLIRIGDDAIDPATAFIQANRLVKNGHDIRLVYNTESDPTYPDYYGLEAIVAPETSALAAVPDLASLLGDSMIGTYVDRHGPDWSGDRRAWGRVVGGGFETGDGTSGVLSGLQAGVELGDEINGWHFGVEASWGTAGGTLDGDGGSADVSSAAAGVYATYIDQGGAYFDLLVQYRGLWADLSTSQTADFSVDGHSLDVAAEAGFRFQPTDGVSVVPFAQLVHQRQMLDDYDDGLFAASFEPADTTGKLGVLVEYEAGFGTVFGSAAIVVDLDGASETVVSDFAVPGAATGPQLQLTAGVEAQVAPSATLAAAGYYRGGEGTGGLGINASLHVAF